MRHFYSPATPAFMRQRFSRSIFAKARSFASQSQSQPDINPDPENKARKGSRARVALEPFSFCFYNFGYLSQISVQDQRC